MSAVRAWLNSHHSYNEVSQCDKNLPLKEAGSLPTGSGMASISISTSIWQPQALPLHPFHVQSPPFCPVSLLGSCLSIGSGAKRKKGLGALPETTPSLPVDPTLEGTPLPLSSQLAALLKAGGDDHALPSSSKSPSVVLSEGIPPLTSKLVERIRRWEYVDLSDVLTEASTKQEESIIQNDTQSQVILVQTVDQLKKKKKAISDIPSWSQAFAIYGAALASCAETSKEEATGLLAHMYLIIQLAKDLGGTRWFKYDQDFRAWAAAKKVKVWGEINLSIYGRCLASPQWSLPSAGDSKAPSKPGGEKKSKPTKTPRHKCCFKHQF